MPTGCGWTNMESSAPAA